MKNIKQALLLLTAVFFIACNNDDDNTNPIEGEFKNGVFILSEGGLGAGNSKVSFISNEGEVEDDIFYRVNGENLGDVGLSMAFYEDLAYIVVNNSNTIEVVNRYTFESVATIAGELNNPRYIVFSDGKGYVSNWGSPIDPADDFIGIIDLHTHTFTAKIPVAEGPERLVAKNNKLYAAHSGGWGYGNSVSIIDLNTAQVTGSFPVSDVPSAMVESNNNLYILSAGKEAWTGEETRGGLFKINLSNHNVTDFFFFPDGIHPFHLQVNGDKVYYTIGNDIYRTETADIELAPSPFISTGTQGVQVLYGFNIQNNWIYISDAKDFASNGELFVYSLTGNLSSRHPVGGVIPNGVYFND